MVASLITTVLDMDFIVYYIKYFYVLNKHKKYKGKIPIA